MQMLLATIPLATVVVALDMMVTLAPQFSRAEDEVDTEVTKGTRGVADGIPTELLTLERIKMYLCGGLVDELHAKLKGGDLFDRDKVFDIGYKKLVPLWKRANRAHNAMAETWKDVRETLEGKKECEYNGGIKVAFLMICSNVGVLDQTMGLDVREYVDKGSSTTEHWEDLYAHMLNHEHFPTKDHEMLKNFIDRTFIENYYEENRAEVLSLVGEAGCRPRQAWKPTFESFKSIVGANLAMFMNDPDSIEDIYEKHVVKPCEKVWPAFQTVMSALQQVSQVINGGPDNFLATLNHDFKDDLFRYKYCSHLFLSEDNIHEQKISIAWNVLYPDLDYSSVGCYA